MPAPTRDLFANRRSIGVKRRVIADRKDRGRPSRIVSRRSSQTRKGSLLVGPPNHHPNRLRKPRYRSDTNCDAMLWHLIDRPEFGESAQIINLGLLGQFNHPGFAGFGRHRWVKGHMPIPRTASQQKVIHPARCLDPAIIALGMFGIGKPDIPI